MKRLFFLAFFLLGACASTLSPRMAMERVNHEFDGRYVGLFFASYGAPAGSKPASDGGNVYRWLSLEPDSGSDEASVITYPGGHFGTIGGLNNGEMVTSYCQIRIRTDAQDKIRNIALVSDSIGKYSGSRCTEIFGQGPE